MTPAAKPDDGGAAFPAGYHPEGNTANQFGMTLRDYFAASALKGLMANKDLLRIGEIKSKSDVAIYCYAYADVLLAARKEALK